MSETATTGEHVRGITEEFAALVRDEVTRVRDEAMTNARAAGRDLALVACAGGAGMAGLFAATIAAVDALHGGTPPRRAGLPLWLSGATVAALAAGAAFTLVRVALGDLRERDLLPRGAIQDLEETAGAVAGELRTGS